MYRLLIVDDEKFIVESMLDLFSRQEDMELEILTAYYGEEALRLLQSKIDVILLDINMPGLSGIDVARQITQNWPLCRIIFLTGYSNFDYIYQSNQMKNTTYLLKTEDNETIAQAVKDAITEIEEEKRQQQICSQLEVNNVYLEYLLHLDVLTDLLHGKKQYELQKSIQDMHNSFLFHTDSPVYLLYMKVKQKLGSENERDFHQYLVQITLFLRQGLNHKFKIVLADLDSRTFVAFLQPDYTAEDSATFVTPSTYIREGINEQLESLSSILPLHLFCLFYNKKVEWNQISIICQQIQEYYTRILLPQYPQYDSCITINEHDLRSFWPAKAPVPSVYPKDTIRELGLALSNENKAVVFQCLEHIQNYLIPLKSLHHLSGIRLYHEISNLYIEYISQYRLEEKLAMQIGLYKLFNLSQFDSWEDLIEYYRQLTSITLALSHAENHNQKEQILTKINAYIEKNLHRNLTLNEIANSVNYNSSYISRYFKQMTGQTIFQHITQIRIEKAKEYLDTGNDSIQKIAENLGFDNVQYFSLVFKKHTGMSPKNYRLRKMETNIFS